MGTALKNAKIHQETVNGNSRIRIWEPIVVFKAWYGLHLAPLTASLIRQWKQLQKLMIVNTVSCFSARIKSRRVRIEKISPLPGQRALKMTALQHRTVLGLKFEKTLPPNKISAAQKNSNNSWSSHQKSIKKNCKRIGRQHNTNRERNHQTHGTIDEP